MVCKVFLVVEQSKGCTPFIECMARNLIIVIITLLVFVVNNNVRSNVYAQPPHNGPDLIYTVQPGDTITLIAMQYNLRVDDLAWANQLAYPYYIYPGQQLVLPQVPWPTPTPQFSGYAPSPQVVVPSVPTDVEGQPFEMGKLHTVQAGETLFSIATFYDIPVNHLILANGITNPDLLQLGQILQIPTGAPPQPTSFPEPFQAVEFSEVVIIQGRTLVIRVALSEAATLTGDIDGRPINFTGSGQQKWGLTAIHAMAEPAQYPIRLVATLPDGRQTTTFRNVTVVAGPYGSENIELVEGRESLLEPTIIEGEWKKLMGFWSTATNRPLWKGQFRYPVDGTANQVTSRFGTRRSYNNGPIATFHSGADFGGGIGRPIYAPAAGEIVLAEPLNVRGNAVLINHGLGVYSGYWHQTEILVEVGQQVQPGDLIGYIGDTGLVTGPHLHWEVRINGYAVDPMQWIYEAIP